MHKTGCIVVQANFFISPSKCELTEHDRRIEWQTHPLVIMINIKNLMTGDILPEAVVVITILMR